jgi:hypothetical protein
MPAATRLGRLARGIALVPGVLLTAIGAFDVCFGTLGVLVPSPTRAGALLFILFGGLLPLAVGLALIGLGNRAWLGWILATVGGAPGRVVASVARSHGRVFLTSSFGRACLGTAVIVALGFLPGNGEAPGMFAALVLTLYSFADPFAFSWTGGGWFRLALQSAAGWVLQFVACMPLADRLHESAMIFLFPMMVYPAALLLGGVLRASLARSRPSAIAAASPGASSQSD